MLLASDERVLLAALLLDEVLDELSQLLSQFLLDLFRVDNDARVDGRLHVLGLELTDLVLQDLVIASVVLLLARLDLSQSALALLDRLSQLV